MRFAFLLPVSVALGTAALIVVETAPDAIGRLRAIAPMPGGGPVARDHRAGETGTDAAGALADINSYRDPELAFDMAIPAGWSPIEIAAHEASGEAVAPGVDGPGHAVGFEAPRDAPGDVFADYVMIEILPGRESGQFLTDGSLASVVEIDGVAGFRDSLVIRDHEVGGVALDLVVHQAEIRGLGWTIGFYAIGEVRHARLVEDAFELMIRTFHLPGPPFRVS